MSIDFGKFKKKPKVEQEIAEENVADIESDKEELSDKSDIVGGELSDNLEKSDIISEKESDKSDNPANLNITSDQLRAIYVLITGKTNRKYTTKTLSNKIIKILTNAE